MVVTIRQFFDVVPNVHLGVVENIFERSEREPEIAVIEMANDCCERIHDKKVVQSDADEREGKILNRIVHNRFHPVET